MLSVGKLGAGQHRYYTAQVAEGAEDYYAGKGEAEGYWLGDGAEDLGLQGKVDPSQLASLLTGNDPATGLSLGLRTVPGRGAVPGFDLTFSAPKSVSLTWALGGHPAAAEVAEAHRASVDAALSCMQRHACLTRRGAGGHEFLQGRGFIAAAFQHRSSRAGDPQLHTHVLVANATRGPDGRFTRLYHPAIYDHAKTAGYIYEAHLRDELTRRLGVRWGEVRNGIAEIEGFDPADLRAFSTRRAEILEAAPDGSARARQMATLETRKAKKRDISAESLRERWREKAEEIGLSRDSIKARMGHERQAPEGSVEIAAVEEVLTAHASHFDRRDVIQAVAESLPAGAPAAEAEELADTFLGFEDVIRIGESPKGDRFTARAIWEMEERALDGAERLAATRDRAVGGELVVSRVLAARPSLKPDQREMVERLLTGGEGLVVVGCPGDRALSVGLGAPGRRGRDGRLRDPGSIGRPRPGGGGQAGLDRRPGPARGDRGRRPLNPTHDLELPFPEPSEVEILAPEVAAELLGALTPEDRVIWATALYAGLRYGELRALRWGAVNLDGGTIRVRESWDPKTGSIAPKTRTSQRTTPVPSVLRGLLLHWRERRGDPSDDDLLFAGSDGKPFHAASLYRRADRVWDRAGFGDRLRLHQARHTYASFMIAAGVNAKALSVFMGHSSIKVTFDLYGHLMPGTEAEAAALLDRFLGPDAEFGAGAPVAASIGGGSG